MGANKIEGGSRLLETAGRDDEANDASVGCARQHRINIRLVTAFATIFAIKHGVEEIGAYVHEVEATLLRGR